MGTQKLNLFIDFDDVVISTRPRLDEGLLNAYKYASPFYWKELKKKIEDDYQERLSKLREREQILRQSSSDVSSLLDELYCQEMNLYTEYVRSMDDVEEGSKYLGVNIDYVLEILNNSDNYSDGDNPNSPYYIDYNEILNMRYAIPNSVEFVKMVMTLPNVNSSILSHKNCKRESIRKEVVIKENIGDIKLHVLDFHSDPFSPGNRCMNSKAEFVMNLYGLTSLDESFILIDDNEKNIKEWISHGGKGILYGNTSCEGIKYQISDLTYETFSNCLDEKQKKLIKR